MKQTATMKKGKQISNGKKDEAENQNVRVSPETYAEVKSYCEENGMKIGWFYNQAAKLYLQELKATA